MYNNLLKEIKNQKEFYKLLMDNGIYITISKCVAKKFIGGKISPENKKNFSNYIAPIYKSSEINDNKLIEQLKKKRPNIILINIGGGTQEVLGLYLKQKLHYNCKILCTGAAISFFTGQQAPINDFIDKFYLGWLIRIIYNPRIFYKRYFYSLKLLKLVILNRVKIIR